MYQKAYLEFFTCKENVMALLSVLPTFPNVNYHIINSKVSKEKSYTRASFYCLNDFDFIICRKGTDDFNNCHKHRPIAVTWGVFPGREVLQPTGSQTVFTFMYIAY